MPINAHLNPETIRANITSRTLKLASKTLEHMQEGLTYDSAQAVCDLLLPSIQASAVAITDTQNYLGFSTTKNEVLLVGVAIRTKETMQVMKDQQFQVIEDISQLENASKEILMEVQAEIIVPLIIREVSVGTLKLYYEHPSLLDHTQIAIATGLAELLSTQLSISELDHQAELATRAELKALQSQINPHFLFNTINTISALIRTDPQEARILLREFAVFYRQTLENSETLIPLEREMAQTKRYLRFEIARFGEERIQVTTQVDPSLLSVQVPSFIIQPIIENSIGHALRPEGPLHIDIEVSQDGDDVLIRIADDGVGMDRKTLSGLSQVGPSASGAGIALKNVRGRLKGYFDADSDLMIESEVDKGTVTTLRLGGAAVERLEG